MIKKGMHSAMIMQLRKTNSTPRIIQLDDMPTIKINQERSIPAETGKILPPKIRAKSPYTDRVMVEQYTTSFPRRFSKMPDSLRPAFPKPQHWAINVESLNSPILESEPGTDHSGKDSMKMGAIRIENQGQDTFDKTELKIPDILFETLEQTGRSNMNFSPSYNVVRMLPTPKKKKKKKIIRKKISPLKKKDKTMSQNFHKKNPVFSDHNTDLKSINTTQKSKTSASKNSSMVKNKVDFEVSIPLHLRTESFKFDK